MNLPRRLHRPPDEVLQHGFLRDVAPEEAKLILCVPLFQRRPGGRIGIDHQRESTLAHHRFHNGPPDAVGTARNDERLAHNFSSLKRAYRTVSLSVALTPVPSSAVQVMVTLPFLRSCSVPSSGSTEAIEALVEVHLTRFPAPAGSICTSNSTVPALRGMLKRLRGRSVIQDDELGHRRGDGHRKPSPRRRCRRARRR